MVYLFVELYVWSLSQAFGLGGQVLVFWLKRFVFGLCRFLVAGSIFCGDCTPVVEAGVAAPPKFQERRASEPSASAATTNGGTREEPSASTTADAASLLVSPRARALETNGALLARDEATAIEKRREPRALWASLRIPSKTCEGGS